jgi:predicted  nucleic acid-binding Zn-ribbon protein
VRTKLILLEELQELDQKSDGVQSRLQECYGEIAALDSRLQTARNSVDAKIAELAVVEGERQELEANLATENGNIARSEANLKGITTQKEYQAVNKEIASAKKMIAELEEQILRRINAAEYLKSDIAAMEEKVRVLGENLEVQKDEVRGRIAEVEQLIAADAAAREATIKAIPASVVKRYEKLREVRRGIAVVEAKDGNCLGCNMHIPPQMYNNLFRGEELITCPHCQRILILKQEQG